MLDINKTFAVSIKVDVNEYISYIENCKNEYKNLCAKVNNRQKKNKKIEVMSIIFIVTFAIIYGLCIYGYSNDFLPSIITFIQGISGFVIFLFGFMFLIHMNGYNKKPAFITYSEFADYQLSENDYLEKKFGICPQYNLIFNAIETNRILSVSLYTTADKKAKYDVVFMIKNSDNFVIEISQKIIEVKKSTELKYEKNIEINLINNCFQIIHFYKDILPIGRSIENIIYNSE